MTALLIPSAHEFDLSTVTESITLSLFGYPKQRQIEAAGRGFHHIAYVQKTAIETTNTNTDSEKSQTVGRKSTRSTLKEDGVKNDDFDFYEVLGLGDIGQAATQEQIKAYYKTACVDTHPDRNMKNGVADDTLFKQVQIAFENLSNPKKKIIYDSSYYFDDSLPVLEGTDASEFYEVMGPAFERWKYWSSVSLPSLGDDNTKYADVEAFYTKWTLFKSWRDFTFWSEHNIDDAENRDERRWMEKQNEKARSQHKIDERKALFKLLEVAKQNDPRIQRRKQQNIENKRKKEEKREQDKLKQQELLEKKKQEERKAAEEERKRQNKEKQKKKEQKVVVQATNDAYKSDFRNMCFKHMVMTQFLTPKQVGVKVLAEHVEYIIMRSEKEELEQTYKDLEPVQNDATEFVKLFNDKVDALRANIRAKLEQAHKSA